MTRGAAAFSMCAIAYQRSVMYRGTDRTSVRRTTPAQLKTCKAYYPSFTLQPLLPSPAQNDSSRSYTVTHHIFNNHVPPFFSFLRSRSYLQVGIFLMLMVRFFCCLHQPLWSKKTKQTKKTKKHWLINCYTHNTFKNTCKRTNSCLTCMHVY